MKRNRSTLVNIVACSVSVVLLVLLALQLEQNAETPQEDDIVVGVTQSSIKIESTIYVDDISLVHPAVNAYVRDTTGKKAKDVFSEYGGYAQSMRDGYPVKYAYFISGIPSGVTLEKAALELGQNENFVGATVYPFENGANNLEIYHLLPGTTYYYRLNLTLSTGNVVGTIGSFTTEASPRFLSIDGIINVRDIGGWETATGRRIKYGVLYRGSELDGGVEPSYLLTEAGRQDMILDLGIRFEMDLRAESDNKGDALGPNVVHKNYPVGQYSDVLTEGGGMVVRNVFADLADPDNYPMYLHCTYGKDRTGTICYLLEALLGVSDKDLRREYELTTFTYGSVASEDFAAFVTRIDVMEGSTTQEKVENYLLSIGVTPEEIESIRSIFLED